MGKTVSELGTVDNSCLQNAKKKHLIFLEKQLFLIVC